MTAWVLGSRACVPVSNAGRGLVPSMSMTHFGLAQAPSALAKQPLG